MVGRRWARVYRCHPIRAQPIYLQQTLMEASGNKHIQVLNNSYVLSTEKIKQQKEEPGVQPSSSQPEIIFTNTWECTAFWNFLGFYCLPSPLIIKVIDIH